MKRVGNIYENIYDLDNIKLAILKSSLGKRNQRYVQKVLNNIEYYALEIQQMLMNQTYTPSPYKIKTIYDGANRKERVIYKPNYYPDQIIHWALILQIQPIFMKGMYKYTCGSVPMRGTTYGQNRIKAWLNKDKVNTQYCLKLDISKFYPSIDNEILKNKVKHKIKDVKCLHLINLIIDSNQGLPIGNYTSQWLSNFFLEDLDHYIKEKLQVKYYVRYVDDMIIFAPTKYQLHQIKNDIKEYLIVILLKLKHNWQIFPISKRAIDFLGLRFYDYKIILRKRNSLRIKRRVNKIKKKQELNYRDACAIVSYWGWIIRSNSQHFYLQYVQPIISIQYAKSIVSLYSKIIV